MAFKWNKYKNRKMLIAGAIYIATLVLLSIGVVAINHYGNLNQYSLKLKAETEEQAFTAQQLNEKLMASDQTLASVSAELTAYLNQDQYQINQALKAEIKAIESTYDQAALVYEDLVELKTKTTKTGKLDEQFALILKLLADRQVTSAAASVKDLAAKIKAEDAKLATTFTIPENIPASNTPPGSGYRRQQVQTEIGTYMVSMVSADLNSTRVVVDTASAADCKDNCPVLPLGDYVSRSGAFAGINGPYFCPATYPTCQDKKNSFDTLLMNKQKVYFNSDNNVYSTVPAVIFSGSSARFVGKSLEWGRSTDPDSVIAAQPYLVSGGNVVFGGDGDPKKGSKGPRGFIGSTGSNVYIGIVHNATVAEGAVVLKTLGVQNALNLDGGGSAALWSGGYKVGPGRALPFGILLVRK